MRLLLIEDDPVLRECVTEILSSNSHQIDTAATGEDGLLLAETGTHQLYIVDLGLPDMDGNNVIGHLREQRANTPILVLSGHNQLENKIESLNTGADDFMIKPFHRDELIARIHAIVRRAEGLKSKEVKIGDLIVDLQNHEVCGSDGPVPLTEKEHQLFEMLCLRKGNPVSKEAILDCLYGGMDEPDIKIIDVFICNLRKKLATANNGDNCIRTVWGRGYALNIKV